MTLPRRYLITGGLGFLGSAIARRLVHAGHRVRVLDDRSRGSNDRLGDSRAQIEVVYGDVRDVDTVRAAVRNIDTVCHCAYINGTEFFYTRPEEVLEVGVKGIINILDCCRQANVRELILASSSEVYQTAALIPTPEQVPLVVPDVNNPRYSYGGGKIISELLTVHYGRKYFDRVLIFRPHNVYGPDMGWEHVVVQLIVKLHALHREDPAREEVLLPIQGDGSQSRAFVYIEDFVDGFMLLLEKGSHLEVYNVGTTEEVTIRDLAHRVASQVDLRITLSTGPMPSGGTLRRCPDISRLARLGYRPRYSLEQGLVPTVEWYWKQLSRGVAEIVPTG